MVKADKWEWLKRVMIIAVTVGSLIGMVYGAISYFAKQKTVTLIDRRLELAIQDDTVNRAQGEVDWIEQRAIFERRTEEKTPTEEDMIERAKQKVIDAKAVRAEKQKAYEAAK